MKCCQPGKQLQAGKKWRPELVQLLAAAILQKPVHPSTAEMMPMSPSISHLLPPQMSPYTSSSPVQNGSFLY